MAKNPLPPGAVAIVGMAGRFPGASSVEELWSLLKDGKEMISRFSPEELSGSGVSRSEIEDPNYVPVKGIVEKADAFDHKFFDYSEREARVMDPQTRLLHEIAWAALEDAGYPPIGYEKPIGLFAGASPNPLWLAEALAGQDGALAGFLADKDYLCARVANRLNLKGPVVQVQTACSTGLVAVHLAIRSLLLGDCELALAGAASIKLPQKVGYLHQPGMIASSDGHCRSFDETADGTVPGEGVALVALKTVAKALRDGDNIHAVIRGTAVNNDGDDKTSFAAPSVKGQVAVIKKALRIAKVEPSDIGYVEAHGTGTLIGDPVEFAALHQVFGNNGEKTCALSTLKPNIGHLDHAAGIAGLIKTVLCLKNRKVPPTLHFRNVNPAIPLERSCFYIPSSLHAFAEGPDGTRRAGVTSLGVGGTNAHVILEESPQSSSSPPQLDQPLFFPISAKTSLALEETRRRLRTHVESNSDGQSLADLSFTLREGRQEMRVRSFCLARNRDELVEALSLERPEAPEPPDGDAARIAFLFPGQGEQYASMGRELYAHNQVFRETVQECAPYLKEHGAFDVLSHYESSLEPNEYLTRTECAQPLLFSFQVAMARVLESCNLRPEYVLGHSAGETAAFTVAGALSLADGARLAATRGRLMATAPRGGMLWVNLPESEVAPLLNPGVWIGAVNAPGSVVLSGRREALELISNKCSAQGTRHQFLPANLPFHTPLMREAMRSLSSCLRELSFSEGTAKMVSSLTASPVNSHVVASADYWTAQACEPVRFADALGALSSTPPCIALDLGPGSTLARVAKQSRLDGYQISPPSRSKEGETSALLQGLGGIWALGRDINWSPLHPASCRRISLPSYPFSAHRFPMGSRPSNDSPAPSSPTSPREKASPRELITDIFRQVLGISEAHDDTDFFASGGDSLTAFEVISKLRARLGFTLSLSQFFDHSTLDELTQLMERGGETRTEFDASIPKAPERETYPLSSAQSRLYVAHTSSPPNIGYNETLHTWLDGPLDVVRLRECFSQLVARHASLRTQFEPVGNDVVQRIVESTPFALEVYECREDQIAERIDQIIRPFDLKQAPLMRVALLRVNEERTLMVWDFHHIVMDGVAMGVLYHELISLYESGQLEPLSGPSYVDYTMWERSQAYQETLQKQERFWLDAFTDGPPPSLDLPLDFPRTGRRSYAGASLTTEVGRELLERTRTVAKTERCSLFMILLSAYYATLYAFTSQDDICVGTVVAGRDHPELRSTVGVFVNMLPLRQRLRLDQTGRSFLEDVRRGSLAAFDNQLFPFDDLVSKTKAMSDDRRHPLFDAAFVLQNMEKDRGEFDLMGDMRLSSHRHNKTNAKFDLTLTAVEARELLYLTWDYRRDLFAKQTIATFALTYEEVLRRLVSAPDTNLRRIATGRDEPRRPTTSTLSTWTF